MNNSASLESYDPLSSNRCNTLCIGCSAVGKSSTINTLRTDENAQIVNICKDAPVRRRNQEEQLTKTYRRYDLNRKVRIFDTWGYTPGANFESGEYIKMLEGRYREDEGPDSILSEAQVNERIIDIVMFIFDGSQRFDENVLSGFVPFYNIAKERGKGIIFVVTKIDLLIENIIIHENPEHAQNVCQNGPQFEEVRLKILDVFEDARIFPMINYKYHAQSKIDLIMKLKMPIINEIIRIIDSPPPPSQVREEFNDLFRGEKVEKIEFPRIPRVIRNLDQNNLTVNTENESKHIFSDIFFRCVNLGVNVFRLFAARSPVDPKLDIIGLFEPKSYSYFECCELKSPFLRVNLTKAFTDNYVPEYMFLTNQGTPHRDLVPQNLNRPEQTSSFVFIELKSQIKPLLFVRKRFEKFHTMIENSIQWTKQIQFERESAFKDFEDLGEKLKLEQEALKLSFQQQKEEIEGELETQKTELQQEMGDRDERLRRELIALIDANQPEPDDRIEGIIQNVEQNERSVERIKEVFQHVSERQIFAEFFPHTSLNNQHFQWEEAIPNREYFKLENQDVNRGTNVYFQKDGVYSISGFVRTYQQRDFWIKKNGNNTYRIYVHGNNTHAFTKNFLCVLEMNSGDYFSLHCNSSCTDFDRQHGSLFIRKLQTTPFHQIHNLNNQ